MKPYTCPFCKKALSEDPYKIFRHMQYDVVLINRIKARFPEWVEQDGSCIKCLEEITKKLTEDS